MKRNLLIGVGAVVVAVVVVGVCWNRRSRPRGDDGGSDHRAVIDRHYSRELAMFRAPRGRTPCETAYNAFRAFEDAPGERYAPPWGRLPDRDTFLQRCTQLSASEQLCLDPSQLKSHSECNQVGKEIFASNRLFDPLPDAGLKVRRLTIDHLPSASQPRAASGDLVAPAPPGPHRDPRLDLSPDAGR